MTEPKFDLEEERLLEFAVWIIRAPLVAKPELLDSLPIEAEELIRIFAASIRTAKNNRNRRKKL